MEADSVQQRMPAGQQMPRCNRDDGRLRQQWAIVMLAGNRPVSRRMPVSTPGQWEFGLRVRHGRPWDLKREQRYAGFRLWNRRGFRGFLSRPRCPTSAESADTARGFRLRTPGADSDPGYCELISAADSARGFRSRIPRATLLQLCKSCWQISTVGNQRFVRLFGKYVISLRNSDS